jgi:predicted ATP-grasp superfamily ATP-dependent carboligase
MSLRSAGNDETAAFHRSGHGPAGTNRSLPDDGLHSTVRASMETATSVRSILLCGGSVRSLAESAIAAGLRPLCVDFFEDEDLTELLAQNRGRFVARIESFMELPKVTHSVRSSIPMLWAGGLENCPDVLRTIAGRRRVIGASPDVLEPLRDPFRLQSWLKAAGLSVPRIAFEFQADTGCTWLRKPIAGSGGFGIRRIRKSNSSTPESGNPSLFGQQRAYFQEYVDGVPMSAMCSMVSNRLQIHGASLQLTGWSSLGASEFHFCGNLGPVDPGEDVSRQILTAATTVVRHSGLTGVFGIDFILRRGRAWFLEVNPRMTASHFLYERHSRGALILEHLAAFGMTVAKRTEPVIRNPTVSDPSNVLCRLILWTQKDFTVPDKFQSLILPQSVSAVHIADCPRAGTVVPRRTPLCSIHVTGSTTEEIESRIMRLPEPAPGLISAPWTAIGTQLRLLRERFRGNL